MTPEQRSRCMSAVKGKDTKPEMIVRKFLFSKGLRYRLHVRSLPGNPDIVLPKYKTVIAVNGCFWHGHEGCKNYRIPKSNVEFWKSKINTNKVRDLLNEVKLNGLGWRVLRIWECEIVRVQDRVQSLERLYNEIVGRQVADYENSKIEIKIAAEETAEYARKNHGNR